MRKLFLLILVVMALVTGLSACSSVNSNDNIRTDECPPDCLEQDTIFDD